MTATSTLILGITLLQVERKIIRIQFNGLIVAGYRLSILFFVQRQIALQAIEFRLVRLQLYGFGDQSGGCRIVLSLRSFKGFVVCLVSGLISQQRCNVLCAALFYIL